MFPEEEKNVPRPSEWVEPDWSHTTLQHWKKAGLADDHHHRHHSKCYHHHHHHLHDNDCGRCVVIIKLVGTPQQRYRLPPRHTITITRQDDDNHDDYNIWSSWLYMTNKIQATFDFLFWKQKKNVFELTLSSLHYPWEDTCRIWKELIQFLYRITFRRQGGVFGQLCYNFCQNGGAEHFGALCVKSW